LCRIQGGSILYRGVQELPCAEYRVVQLLYRRVQKLPSAELLCAELPCIEQ